MYPGYLLEIGQAGFVDALISDIAQFSRERERYRGAVSGLDVSGVAADRHECRAVVGDDGRQWLERGGVAWCALQPSGAHDVHRGRVNRPTETLQQSRGHGPVHRTEAWHGYLTGAVNLWQNWWGAVTPSLLFIIILFVAFVSSAVTW